MENRDSLFWELSEYIDSTDYSSYTLQYPPPFLGENDFEKSAFHKSFLGVEKTGIYIHVPFCDTKCSFCRYYSFVKKDQDLYNVYVEYLCREALLYRKSLSDYCIIDSLYIWWGTPSILSKENLERLLWYIFDIFKFSDDFQFCFEANPSSVTHEKVKVLKKYNCHRFTLWVQSMDPLVLKKVIRFQTKKEVTQSIIWAKQERIPYINIDLMLGITDQTLKSFLKDLYQIIALKPHMIHLHTFCPTELTIDGSVDKKTVRLQQEMNRLWYALLKKYGFQDIEWDALGTDENASNKQLKQAISLWKYIWLWTSAVGFNWDMRYINTDSIEEYFKSIELNHFPVKFAKKLRMVDNMRQYIIYQMRYGKIYREEYRRKFGEDIMVMFQEVISYLEWRGISKITLEYISFDFSSPQEYQIYSKYFYDERIIEYFIQLKD